MKTQLSVLFITLLVMIMSSCHEETPISVLQLDRENFDLIVRNPRLKFDTEELSANDACIVGDIVVGKQPLSRAIKKVKNVVTINGKDNNPAIYAVNYEDGFILVSATTKYFPVLAEVEHGTFTLENINETGLSVIIADMLENINAVRTGSVSLDCTAMWNKFKEDSYDKMNQVSRASDDFGVAFESFFSQFDLVNTSRLYMLNSPECRELLPEDVYEEFCNVADAEDYWAETPYSWDKTAVVIATDYSQAQEYGQYTWSEWSQEEPYNTSGYDGLGCLTVAVGQIMKFFKYPENIPWDRMRNIMYASYQSPELTEFLKQLRMELQIDSLGAGYMIDAQRVLQEYGYMAEFVVHDVQITGALREKPIIASGHNQNYDSGHAWVIDGYKIGSADVTEYTLYRLHDAVYPQFDYEVTEPLMQWRNTNNPVPQIKYRMNWGWGGYMNGWYDDYRIPEIQKDYSMYREDMIVDID